jgi:hypothetical protein
LKERVVIEPSPSVAAETPIAYGKDNFPKAEGSRMEDDQQIPENQKPSFARKIDQLYQE